MISSKCSEPNVSIGYQMFESAPSNSVLTEIVVLVDQGQDVVEINEKYKM